LLEDFFGRPPFLSFSRAAATFIGDVDRPPIFAEWCQQRRLVGLRSYDDSFVVADDHRPVLEPWVTPRGLGSGSSLVDGIEVADQNVAVRRAPLPEVIGNDSKLPAWSLLVDEFRHAVTPCAVLLPSTSEPKISIECRCQDNHTKWPHEVINSIAMLSLFTDD
jgi:hypothetical protein